MNRHELKRALKRITANTKRLAKLTAPPKPRRRRAFYVPPRAPEPVVEPCFAPVDPFWSPPTPISDVLAASLAEGLLDELDVVALSERPDFVVSAPVARRTLEVLDVG